MSQHRTLILGTILLGLAAGSWWLRQETQTVVEHKPRPPHTADYWVEQLNALTTDAQGRPRQRLMADAMRHYPDDDSTELDRPKLQLLEPGRPSWHIRSESGWVSPDAELILLQGEVQIDRAAAKDVLPVHLLTRDLRVQPKEEYAETDQSVRADSGRSWVNAEGMQAWLREPVRIKLLSQVRAHYEVTPP